MKTETPFNCLQMFPSHPSQYTQQQIIAFAQCEFTVITQAAICIEETVEGI